MSTNNGLKERITKTLETLPESTLWEVETFIEYLQYRASHGVVPKTPYTPVALGGLWQDTGITDADIDEVRREMWSGFGERDL